MEAFDIESLMNDAIYWLEEDPSLLNIIDDPAPWLAAPTNLPHASPTLSQTSTGSINEPIPMEIEMDVSPSVTNPVTYSQIAIQAGAGAPPIEDQNEIIEIPGSNAFDGMLQDFHFKTSKDCSDLNQFLKHFSTKLRIKLSHYLQSLKESSYGPDTKRRRTSSD